MNNNPTYMQHEFWENPRVFPYIRWYTNIEDSDPVARANECAVVVGRVRDHWEDNVSRPFEWAWWPQNFGGAIPGRGISAFFHHPSDYVNGTTSVFSANGRAQYSAWSSIFIAAFKNALVNLGLPDPIYIDIDYESDAGNLWIYGSGNDADFHHCLQLYEADSRYDTELIDGRITLKHFVDNYTDLDGNTVPYTNMFSPVYGYGPVYAKRANMFTSLHCMCGDWMLHDTFYKYAKQQFPNVLCGNYNYSAASRQHPGFVVRFKESPVDFNVNMYQDVSVWSAFDLGWWDVAQPTYGVDWGLYQYYEVIHRYGINTSQSATGIMHDIFLANIDFNTSCQFQSAPNKQSAIWLSYLYASLGGNSLSLNSNYFPPSGVSLPYNQSLLSEVFTITASNHVNHIGLFDIDLFNSGAGNAAMNFWTPILANLGTYGYNV